MILQPVLIRIPEDNTLSGPERVVRQREYARRALAACAELRGIRNVDWIKDENNVPQPCAGHHWSVSHKPRWAAAVIANGPVGIDIEHVKPRRANLFDQVADENEWSVVGGRSWPAFFRVWTAKEAVLKANGVGIGKLSACQVVESLGDGHLALDYNGRTWHVRHFLHGDHVAAVTADEDAAIWHVHDGPDVARGSSGAVQAGGDVR